MRLGLGMASLGRPAYINVGHAADFAGAETREAMRARAFAVLDAAYAHGIRYVDAARSYGDAERFVRGWLDARGLRPYEVTVGSKWGYEYVGGWQVSAKEHERKEHSRAMLDRQLEETTSILGEFLALYQIHSATPATGVLANETVLDGLARLKARGVRIGVTVSGPSQAETIRRAMDVRRDGATLFASVQATWNLLEPSCEDALGDAHEAGLVVLVKEALANGRLTARGDAGAAGPLAEVAASLGATLDAVAIAAALAQPWADVVLLGASTTAQLDSNAKAMGLTLGPEDLARLRIALRADRDVLARSRRAGLGLRRAADREPGRSGYPSSKGRSPEDARARACGTSQSLPRHARAEPP